MIAEERRRASGSHRAAAVPAYRVQLPWCAVRRSASLVFQGSKRNGLTCVETKILSLGQNSDANRIARTVFCGRQARLLKLAAQGMIDGIASAAFGQEHERHDKDQQ